MTQQERSKLIKNQGDMGKFFQNMDESTMPLPRSADRRVRVEGLTGKTKALTKFFGSLLKNRPPRSWGPGPKRAVWDAKTWYDELIPTLRSRANQLLIWNDEPKEPVAEADAHVETDRISDYIASLLEDANYGQLMTWKSSPSAFWDRREFRDIEYLAVDKFPEAANQLLWELTVGMIRKNQHRSKMQWLERVKSVLLKARWQSLLNASGVFEVSNIPVPRDGGMYRVVRFLRTLEINVSEDKINKKDAMNKFKEIVAELAPFIEYDTVQDYTKNKKSFAGWAEQVQRRLRVKINQMSGDDTIALGAAGSHPFTVEGDAKVPSVADWHQPKDVIRKPSDAREEKYTSTTWKSLNNISVGILKLINYMGGEGSGGAMEQMDVQRVNDFRERMGAQPIDEGIVFSDDHHEEHMRGAIQLHQPKGLEAYEQTIMAFDPENPDPSTAALQTQQSVVLGQPWSINDEIYLRDIIGQLECFMTWTHSPDWADPNAGMSGDSVGAITFDMSKDELEERMKRHAFRGTESRQDTLWKMHRNIARMYGYSGDTKDDLDYLFIMNMYCMQAALKSIHKDWSSLSMDFRRKAKYIKRKKSPKNVGPTMSKMQKYADRQERNGGDLLVRAADQVVITMQRLKAEYDWREIMMTTKRIQLLKDNYGVWQEQGPAEDFGTLIAVTYRNKDTNPWTQSGDAHPRWKVRSPVDPNWVPIQKGQTPSVSLLSPDALRRVGGRHSLLSSSEAASRDIGSPQVPQFARAASPAGALEEDDLEEKDEQASGSVPSRSLSREPPRRGHWARRALRGRALPSVRGGLRGAVRRRGGLPSTPLRRPGHVPNIFRHIQAQDSVPASERNIVDVGSEDSPEGSEVSGL
jgi:hypothetical protein